MRNYFGNAVRAMDRMIDRLDAQRTIDEEDQPAYLRLVHAELASFLPNFINCEAGDYWYDTILGRHNCQFGEGSRPKAMLVTFNAGERSSNKFVISPAWFETDGRDNPVSVDGNRVRQAYQRWLRGKSGPAPVAQVDSPRRKVALKGGC